MVSPTFQLSGASASSIEVSPFMGSTATFRWEVFSCPWISTLPWEIRPRLIRVGSQSTSILPLLAMMMSTSTSPRTGSASVPAVSVPSVATTRVSTTIFESVVVENSSLPSTRTVKSRASETPSYVTVTPSLITTFASSPGIFPSAHVSGSNQEPLETAKWVASEWGTRSMTAMCSCPIEESGSCGMDMLEPSDMVMLEEAVESETLTPVSIRILALGFTYATYTRTQRRTGAA